MPTRDSLIIVQWSRIPGTGYFSSSKIIPEVATAEWALRSRRSGPPNEKGLP
jgi:hypothetical protein